MLNSNIKSCIRNEEEWKNVIQLFDKLQSIPDYHHEFSPFNQNDGPNLFLSFDGNTQEDDEYDDELATIEKVISDSVELTSAKEAEIDNIINQVVSADWLFFFF